MASPLAAVRGLVRRVTFAENGAMPADRDHDSQQRLTSGVQISSVLRRLLDEHTLLTVSFPDSTELFTSAVLSVDAQAGRFSLDELNPNRGHQQVRPGSVLRIEGRLHGVDTRFLAAVEDIGIENGIYFYRLAFPEYLIYKQRRQYHRVPVKLTLQHGISLTGEHPGYARARLTDISAGGLGGTVTDGSPLVAGARYTCSIQLAKEAPIVATVEIRFAAKDNARQQRFGAMFVDVSPQDRRRITRLVMELERELRRTT